MEKEIEEAEKWPVWINWDRRIVSFEEVEGFERLEYPSHDEMFQFAIDKTMVLSTKTSTLHSLLAGSQDIIFRLSTQITIRQATRARAV